MKSILIIFAALIIVVFGNCSKEDEPRNRGGSWSQGWPNLYHDGEPVEGENFVVYSDRSSQAWRAEVAGLAEKSLTDIMTRFDLTYDDFDFVPLQSDGKIDILTNYDQWNFALAYRDGIIIRSKDGPNFYGDHQRWQHVFQHEITHVVEFLLIGTPNRSNSSAVWMREGFGNYGARNHRIQTVEELESWREKMKDVSDHGNPIFVTTWSDFPQTVIDGGKTLEYYGFFELAVRYLLDEKDGNGTNIENMKAYFEDIGSGFSYRVAFKKHFGLDVSEFRDNYWTLMAEYLSKAE